MVYFEVTAPCHAITSNWIAFSISSDDEWFSNLLASSMSFVMNWWAYETRDLLRQHVRKVLFWPDQEGGCHVWERPRHGQGYTETTFLLARNFKTQRQKNIQGLPRFALILNCNGISLERDCSRDCPFPATSLPVAIVICHSQPSRGLGCQLTGKPARTNQTNQAAICSHMTRLQNLCDRSC